MLSTAAAIPTLPMVSPFQMVMPMKQNVSSCSSAVSMATIDRKLTKSGGLALPPRPLVLKSMSLERSRFITYGYNNTRKEKNNSLVCSAALGSRCAATQTQTVTRKSASVTIAPPKGKLKSPVPDRTGGTGKPPFGGRGGGGGGGGGGQFSGGFFLFGLILFLSYWKDKESQGEYAEKKRRKLYQLWGRVYQ